MAAWSAGDTAEIDCLNAEFLASRESAELRAETAQMGFSMRRLLRDLRDDSLSSVIATVEAMPEVAFPTVWAGIAACWQIEPEAALTAYLWSWAENQVMAALKAVPLGQAAGQRLLADLGRKIPDVTVNRKNWPKSKWSNFTPAFAIACARHETQYSRLFRS
jgi:urease accessory protein